MTRVLSIFSAIAVLPAFTAALSLDTAAESRAPAPATTTIAHYSEQAWLDALMRCGDGSSLSKNWQARIFRTSAGRLYVPSRGERQTIASLRRDREARQSIAACLAAPADLAPESIAAASPKGDAALVAEVGPANRFDLGRGLGMARPIAMLSGTIAEWDGAGLATSAWQTSVLSAR